jgi:predicted nucleic acid-binding protein
VIYFDAAYVAKCYLNEPGADRVREVAYAADGLASCELARLEFASILKRHVRERHVTRREMKAILKEFEEDEGNGVWQWFGVTSELLEKARNAVLDIPSTVFLRAGDALHLACAEEHGFQEVYTNDRHMLKARAVFPPDRRGRPRRERLRYPAQRNRWTDGGRTGEHARICKITQVPRFRGNV